MVKCDLFCVSVQTAMQVLIKKIISWFQTDN